MKIKLTLAFIIFSSLTLFAQTDFQPGYIVKLNGDTIKGFVDSRSFGRNREICDFKVHLVDSTARYTPNDLTGYGITKYAHYSAREFQYKDKSMKLFLEFIVQGRIVIFFFRDELGDHYLIDKMPIGIAELVFRYETVSTDAGYFQRPSKKHIGILKYYLADAPDLFPQIERMEVPTRKALIEIAKAYQAETCQDTTCVMFGKKEEKIKLNFEVTQGILHYFEDQIPYRYEIGALFLVNLPNLNKRLNFKSGFYYSKPKIDIDENSKDSIVAFNMFRLPILLQYQIGNKKFSPVAEFGYCIYSLNPYLYHTLNLGLGFAYKVEKKMKLNCGVDVAISPIQEMNSFIPYFISHSLYLGLQF